MSQVDEKIYNYQDIRPMAEILYCQAVHRARKKTDNPDLLALAEQAIDDAETFQNVWDECYSEVKGPQDGPKPLGLLGKNANFPVDAIIEADLQPVEFKMKKITPPGYALWMLDAIAAHEAGFISKEDIQKCYEGYTEARYIGNSGFLTETLNGAFTWSQHPYGVEFWRTIWESINSYLASLEDASSK